jgi:hypothetical protein
MTCSTLFYMGGIFAAGLLFKGDLDTGQTCTTGTSSGKEAPQGTGNSSPFVTVFRQAGLTGVSPGLTLPSYDSCGFLFNSYPTWSMLRFSSQPGLLLPLICIYHLGMHRTLIHFQGRLTFCWVASDTYSSLPRMIMRRSSSPSSFDFRAQLFIEKKRCAMMSTYLTRRLFRQPHQIMLSRSTPLLLLALAAMPIVVVYLRIRTGTTRWCRRGE